MCLTVVPSGRIVAISLLSIRTIFPSSISSSKSLRRSPLNLSTMSAVRSLAADIVDKFRGDLRKLFELDMDDGKIVRIESKEIATILPEGTTVKHIRLIVNWFESHRIIGPIGTAVKKYRKASTCRYVDEGASVVVWGPKQLATLYPVDESTILRSRHAKFLKEVQSAAELVAIENPSDFDAKMNSLGKICRAHQAL